MFCSVWKISCHDSLTDYSAPCSQISGIQRLMAQVYDAHKMTGDFEEQCKLFVASSNKPALLLVKEAAACLLYSCVQRFKFCWCRNVQCAQWSRQPQARRLLVSTQLCKTHNAYTVCTITAYHVSFLGSSQSVVSLPVTEGALLLSTPICYTAFPPVHPFPLSRVLMYKKYSTL